jgi:hypothetical protein
MPEGKGFCPYAWLDDIKKLGHKGPPTISALSSSLKQDSISEDDYKHVQKAYQTLKCEKPFNDYRMNYLACDVLLLADLFKDFRRTCVEYSKFDPTNYLTAPGLAWDAMLLTIKAKLDLVTDVEMLSMSERQKRDGLCFVGSNRPVNAHIIFLQDYNTERECNYIVYW